MCPEVIFTSGAFQVNYYKETACEIHKKVLPVFSHHPGEDTSFAATLEHRHEKKMINNAPNRQHLSFFKTVPGVEGLSQPGEGFPAMAVCPPAGAEDPGGTGTGPPRLSESPGVCSRRMQMIS